MSRSHYFAAVDLGSNSFHMVIAREEGDQLHIFDRLREMVQLGAGIDAQNNLSDEAQLRALDCLERFGQRLRDIPRGQVRAVGTNTLRKAGNAEQFIDRAEAALGHPIGIIAGREEARLIYRGVAGTTSDDGLQRLVVDIGGGSTEYIIGQRDKALYRESLQMGCVSMTRRHFPDGKVDKRSMRNAELDAARELQVIDAFYRNVGWSTAIGSSGTAHAINRILIREGWSTGGIDRTGLVKLRKAIINDGNAERLAANEASPSRVAVLPGGLAILLATFDVLSIEQMQLADGALREGLLFELVGRAHSDDVHEKTVNSLLERYRVDRAQSTRVERTALALLRQITKPWLLDDELSAQLLSWAARLHELGLFVAHQQFHRHGAYLLRHADLAGFSSLEQRLLATLVQGHRRKFPRSEIEQLPAEQKTMLVRICVLLRIAVLLNRGRSETPPPIPDVTVHRVRGGVDGLRLTFPNDWLEAHPLTIADLDEERRQAEVMGIVLHAA